MQGSTKTVTIDCGKHQDAGVQGTYGGASFGVSCQNGNVRSVPIMPTGTTYGFRVGVQDSHGAYDCAFQGDAASVSESCVGTLVTIQ